MRLNDAETVTRQGGEIFEMEVLMPLNRPAGLTVVAVLEASSSDQGRVQLRHPKSKVVSVEPLEAPGVGHRDDCGAGRPQHSRYLRQGNSATPGRNVLKHLHAGDEIKARLCERQILCGCDA